jgi:hypothetical protein
LPEIASFNPRSTGACLRDKKMRPHALFACYRR